MDLPRNRAPRVIFVTFTVPWNPRYGGALRCNGVLRGLAERCELHVAFAGSNPASVDAFMTWLAPEGIARHVLSPGKGWDPAEDHAASRTVRAALGQCMYRTSLRELEHTLQPDIVWYFQVESLRRGGLPAHASVVLDHDNVRWRVQVRLAQRRAGMRRGLTLAKAALLWLDDIQLTVRVKHSLVASPEDIRLLWPMQSVSALPNGFDFPVALTLPTEDNAHLLFFGSLFYEPNVDGVRWMCREVWPLIRARRPDAQLDVVGLGHDALADLVKTPGVTFHGFVDDLNALMRQAALVVPLRVAGGTRIKILEAWAKGLPVVSTTIGAEGLAARDGESLLLADTAEAFADRCVDVLKDAELRRRLAAAGYEHGHSQFDWSVVNTAIDPVLAKCLE